MMRLASTRLVAIAAITVALAGGTVAITSEAAAHTSLVVSDPPDGAILSGPPDSVTFTFDEPLLPGTSTLVINQVDGSVAAAAQVEPSGATVAIDWPAELGPGSYQVAYRVVSADGHPVSGAIWIEVAEPAAAGMASIASTEPSKSPPASAPAAVGTAESAAWAPELVAAIAVSLLALGIALVVLLRRR